LFRVAWFSHHAAPCWGYSMLPGGSLIVKLHSSPVYPDSIGVS
jgi:hypothetical protein